MPIGNLTSQILANVYLNELDRYVRHTIQPQAYLRYGDDFLIFEPCLEKLERLREDVVGFLKLQLSLDLNLKSDRIVKVKHGIKYLGVFIYPHGRKLTKRNVSRAFNLVNPQNCSSYRSLIKHHQKKKLREFDWSFMEEFLNE